MTLIAIPYVIGVVLLALLGGLAGYYVWNFAEGRRPDSNLFFSKKG